MAEVEVSTLRAGLEGLPQDAADCMADQPARACVDAATGDAQRVILVFAGLEALLEGAQEGASEHLAAAAGDDLLGAIATSSGAIVRSASDPARAGRDNLAAIGLAARILGPEHEYIAQLQLNQAWFAYAAGDQQGILTACGTALRDPAAPWLDSAPGVLCRNWIGGALFGERRYGEAEALWSASMRWYDANVPVEDPGRVMISGNLGRSATEGGRPAEGLPWFEAAIAGATALHGPSSQQVSTYRWYLADALTRSGDHPAAVTQYGLILEERTTNNGPEAPETLQALEWLAVAEQKRGHYASADRRLRRAERVIEATGQGPAWRASLAGKRAELYREMGWFDRALPLAARAVTLAEQASGADSSDVAAYLVNEANLLRTMGDLAGAKARYERALALFEAHLGPEHQFVATALTNVAGLALDLGDRAQAKPLLTRAVAIYEAVLPADHEFVATAHNNLGSFLLGEGDADGAVEHLVTAAQIWERALGVAHPNTLTCWQNLAQALLGLGRPGDAAELLGAAADRAERRLGASHHAAALVRTQHAEAVSFAGDQASAARIYRAALPRLEKALGADHPALTRPLVDQARVERLLGREDDARRLIGRADAVVQSTVLPLLDATSERERLRLLQSLRTHADLALSMYARPSDAARAWSIVQGWKGAVLGSLQAQRAQGSSDPTHRAAADRLTDVRQHLAESVFGRSADRAETVGALTAEKERLERLLASAGGRAETLTPAALCAHLGPDEALVDYVRYTRRGEAVTTDGVRAEADPVLSYLAFVFVGGCDAPARIELGPAAPIEAALKAWRRGVAAGKSVDRRGAELRAALWTPLEAALATRTRIAVLPDGVLSGLPFGALPDGDGYLVERVTLAYPGTAAALVRSPAQPGAGALVVGGVDYASGAVAEDALATRSPSRGGLPMSFLPGTAAEADAIVGLLGDGTDRLSGGQATEAQVRARLPGRRVAHIATHGFFAAAGGDDGVVAPGSEAALRTSPLLRTGLVLAGAASDTPRPGGDDGLLTAEEILGLDLTGLELVVLSACETGLGAVEDGEGVMGMRRAFSLAGAGTLVLSLWKVPDEPTRALMTALYGRLTAGDDPATALTTAQRALVRAARDQGVTAHPRDWAAFVASGPLR